MNKINVKACGRCQKEIQCNPLDIENCACTKIKLHPETLEFLKSTQYDCLCNECLAAVDKLVQQADTAPTRVTENIHYYLENGLLVFTELNHIQRGYCCQSGCRHCAYGYQG